MKNPWLHLDKQSNKILSEDSKYVEAFNHWNNQAVDYHIHTHLLPEPFLGNPESSVYLLSLNPGYSEKDEEWHTKADFRAANLVNLSHGYSNYPFYLLNPNFSESPGGKYWLGKCKWLIESLSLEFVSNNLFCIELFPYHSKKYKPIPKKISPNGLVPSSAYTVYLLRTALKENKTVVAMRAIKKWCELVPELINYKYFYRLNSSQNVSLSPNNLPEFNIVVKNIEEAA